MIILMLLISAVIYAILALKTNTVFYRAAASLLFRKDTALVICAVSIFSVVWVQQLTMMSMLVHVAVFTPLSILLYRLGANQMPLILGLLLSDEILFTSQQIMQIYLQ
jgi:hypothetical protein